MASGHEMNLNEHPDRSPCTRGSSCNLDDFNSLPDENLLGSSSSNEVSQASFHHYHGNGPNLYQNLHSSSHQPLNSRVNLIRLHLPQPPLMGNMAGSFRPLYHQSPVNVSSMGQEKYIFLKPRSEIRFSGNEGASDSFSIPNRRLLSKGHNSSENRRDRIQEMHTRTEQGVNEFSANQDSLLPIQNFGERNKNPLQGFESLTQQQSGNEPISSQSSYPLSPQPHQSISNIVEKAPSGSRNAFGNELSVNQATNFPSNSSNSGESSRIEVLPMQSFQNSVCRSENIQSLHPKRLQQSENQFHRQSVIKSTEDYDVYSPTKAAPNKSNTNQYLHLQSSQPVENETRAAMEVHSLPQAFTQNPNKRQSPHSQSQQQFKRRLCGISEAESQPSTSSTSYPLPGNSPRMGNFINEKQSTSLDQVPDNVIGIKSADLSILQHPYSNRSERIKLLVYGPEEWTSPLLQTSAGGGLRLDSPNILAFERNVTRCGILMTVSVWKIDDLIGCVPFLKSTCLASKSTIIFVLDVIARPKMLITLDTLVNLMRRDISPSVPIILVGSKISLGITNNELDDLVRETSLTMRDTCFRLKAKYGLSAYLECSVDSTEEVEAVMFTAIDVSFLKK